MIHAKIKRTVTFREHAIRNASAASELLSGFTVSSPFRLSRSSGPGDPSLLGRFAKPPRRATRRPPFRRSRQKMFRRGGGERNVAQRYRELLENKHILGRPLHFACAHSPPAPQPP